MSCLCSSWSGNLNLFHYRAVLHTQQKLWLPIPFKITSHSFSFMRRFFSYSIWIQVQHTKAEPRLPTSGSKKGQDPNASQFLQLPQGSWGGMNGQFSEEKGVLEKSVWSSGKGDGETNTGVLKRFLERTPILRRINAESRNNILFSHIFCISHLKSKQ